MRVAFVLLLSLVCSLSIAAPPHAANVKNWTFKEFGDGTASGTTSNDSGSSLSLYCAAAKQCFIFLVTDTGCEEDGKYVVLINSDSGAITTTANCTTINAPDSKGRFALVFDNFDDLLKSILHDHTIGFSIPLASGMFKVTRFSLEGSNEVLAAVGQAVGATAKPAVMKDQVL